MPFSANNDCVVVTHHYQGTLIKTSTYKLTQNISSKQRSKNKISINVNFNVNVNVNVKSISPLRLIQIVSKFRAVQTTSKIDGWTRNGQGRQIIAKIIDGEEVKLDKEIVKYNLEIFHKSTASNHILIIIIISLSTSMSTWNFSIWGVRREILIILSWPSVSHFNQSCERIEWN